MRVLITGAAGQDGRYLAERLTADGAEVHGLVRSVDTGAAADLVRTSPGIRLHRGDLADHNRLGEIVDEVAPEEIYNLAGISSVASSWTAPVLTAELSGVAAAVLMTAALRLQDKTGKQVSFVQASSAEIFGAPDRSPQDESTPIRPVSPYGAAKAYAHHMAGVYRGRGLHASGLILFSHESPRRPATFVTRKITATAARIALDGAGTIRLGNISARRDWGWAPDYVDAMVRAARHHAGDDFVVATGEAHSVSEFAEAALRCAGIGDSWSDHIEIDAELLRPAEASATVGDASKARAELGWAPTVKFEEIVARMVAHDMAATKRD